MKQKRKYKPTIRKASKEVFEIVKSHWPLTPAEIMQLKHYTGNAKTVTAASSTISRPCASSG